MLLVFASYLLEYFGLANWQSSVAPYIERLLLDSSLPPHQIAWYVKSLTSEEELVGDTRATIMLTSSTQIKNRHVYMHGWHSCSQIRFSVGEWRTTSGSDLCG